MPEVYFGGSSPIAGEFAAKHVDVYLTWGEPPAAVAEKIAWIRGLAAKEGRTLRLGIRLHVITRDTPEQAWAEAKRLLEGFDPENGANGPGWARPRRVRGAAADARPARRRPRPSGHPPQPVGRHRPGPRRRGHRPGRQP
ncbi:LLM class flavin-dependent oxidoreductase [Streptomyces sp. NBC_01352]|uniref:LLM class flavin-dependent oxidoreductase n=1 Tax=Streptomyces sp. NBC_01352 TaxID=2903834 RepID=UPI003FCDE188